MSDTNEPPRPDVPADEPASPPPSSEAPPPAPPPPPLGDNPAPPPSSPYGGEQGRPGGYGGDAGGGYGAPPPYAEGRPSPSSYSPTGAIAFGWDRFKASPATLLIPTLVIGVVVIVISVIIRVIVVGGLTDSNSGLGAVLVAAALSGAITSLITQILAAGLYKGGADVADGRPFSLGTMFEGWDKLQVVVAAIIIGLLTLVGTILCYLPALIVGYFTQFTLLFIVDKHMSATDALAASFRLCMNNLGPTILFYLLAL